MTVRTSFGGTHPNQPTSCRLINTFKKKPGNGQGWRWLGAGMGWCCFGDGLDDPISDGVGLADHISAVLVLVYLILFNLFLC